MTSEPGEPSSAGPGRPYFLTPSVCQHETRSKHLILAAAEAVAPKRAIVLGAGNCRDIPLAELAARFASVTLNDVDAALVESGIAAAGLDDAAQSKIQRHVLDLTGATDALLAQFDAALADAADADAAIEAMADIVDRQPLGPAPLEGTYDLVVASCVLSQLHFGLTQRAAQRFEARFAGQFDRLRQSRRWSTSLYHMARRMEAQFMDTLATLTEQSGVVYLSATPQMCYVKLTADGQWETEGTYRLLRTQEVADYVDRRFAIIDEARWHWVVSPPAAAGETGRLYDVQAFLLRKWRR